MARIRRRVDLVQALEALDPNDAHFVPEAIASSWKRVGSEQSFDGAQNLILVHRGPASKRAVLQRSEEPGPAFAQRMAALLADAGRATQRLYFAGHDGRTGLAIVQSAEELDLVTWNEALSLDVRNFLVALLPVVELLQALAAAGLQHGQLRKHLQHTEEGAFCVTGVARAREIEEPDGEAIARVLDSRHFPKAPKGQAPDAIEALGAIGPRTALPEVVRRLRSAVVSLSPAGSAGRGKLSLLDPRFRDGWVRELLELEGFDQVLVRGDRHELAALARSPAAERPLIDRLRDPGSAPAVRARAALALGGGPRPSDDALAALELGLDDPHSAVRAAVLEAVALRPDLEAPNPQLP